MPPNALLEDFAEPNKLEEPLEFADEAFAEEPQEVFGWWRNEDEVEFIFRKVFFESTVMKKVSVEKDQIKIKQNLWSFFYLTKL